MSEIGLIGKKIGMTREFLNLSISSSHSFKSRKKDSKLINKETRGYNAVRLGFQD